MIRPRASLGRLMVIMVFVALDCGLVRLLLGSDPYYGLQGLFAIGLTLSLGMLGAFLASGWLRRFSLGFTVTGLVASLLGLALLCFLGATQGFQNLYERYYIAVLERIPIDPPTPVPHYAGSGNSPEVWWYHPGILRTLLIDLAFGLPVVSVALVGGLLTLVFRRPERPTPAPDPTPT